MLSSFQIEMLCYAAMGAFALWLRLKYGNFWVAFDSFVADITDDLRMRVIFHLALFVILGALLSVAFAEPTTKKQALAAGMGWTGVFSGPMSRPRRSR
jgi:hypothetical protein